MNKEKSTYKFIFWSLWIVLTLLCSYYIVYNAQWLIGDDAIVIRHIGYGNPFLPSNSVNLHQGRFYPFSYLVYNLLLLLNVNYILPSQIYMLQSFFFFIFCVSTTILLLKVTQNEKEAIKLYRQYNYIIINILKRGKKLMRDLRNWWY